MQQQVTSKVAETKTGSSLAETPDFRGETFTQILSTRMRQSYKNGLVGNWWVYVPKYMVDFVNDSVVNCGIPYFETPLHMSNTIKNSSIGVVSGGQVQINKSGT